MGGRRPARAAALAVAALGALATLHWAQHVLPLLEAGQPVELLHIVETRVEHEHGRLEASSSPSATRHGAEAPRGWHWERRWGPPAGPRVSRPVSFPATEDPGALFVPFDASRVHPTLRDAPRLHYDVLLVRVRDELGLVDDMYSAAELEEILQHVVDAFAVANVYVRFALDEVRRTHQLPTKSALVYLNYLEGPDKEELQLRTTAAAAAAAAAAGRKRLEDWAKRANQEHFGVDFVDLLRGQRKADSHRVRSMFEQDYLDWALGFPMWLTPWDMVHSTALFPVHYFHNLNGIGGSGRVVLRTASCWEHEKRAKDPATGEDLGPITCRRFQGDLSKRQALKSKPYKRGHEKLRLTGRVGARLWAHELGHQLSLKHPHDGKCTLFPSWDEGQLMVQQRFVGTEAEGCSSSGHEAQGRAMRLTEKEMLAVREFVKGADIRPSRTLAGAVTIGENTMQLGAASRGAASKLSKHLQASYTGLGASLRHAKCGLAQGLVVLPTGAGVRFGRVARLRWMPTAWSGQGLAKTVEVIVARPQERRGDGATRFTVLARSGPLKVQYGAQRAHVELDLPEPLPMQAGSFLALAAEPGAELRIDRKIYASPYALYADVVGNRTEARGLLRTLAEFSDLNTTYPRVALAAPRRDAFLWAAAGPHKDAHDFWAAQAPRERACTELLANFDLVQQ